VLGRTAGRSTTRNAANRATATTSCKAEVWLTRLPTRIVGGSHRTRTAVPPVDARVPSLVPSDPDLPPAFPPLPPPRFPRLLRIADVHIAARATPPAS